ncbi:MULTISPECIES: FKBP-type peptidyl-prolyl cis-trans isomerase [Flammeovirga]|uniref:Peptidyl-prolyl cis-trans isomerase n=1 Tax=Flammeovirga agarivorans TaxID=2726742 RepID=A0A7X8SMM9_9BACT|nr:MULTISPECIES: FKBP-type peptidyl-prolyl cis-trans isomerase [Flammeovirga]NLR92966.1 FKBP-type peptidyl-prolyl cis-trans isomerase [Flammeovirga agarivorans]
MQITKKVALAALMFGAVACGKKEMTTPSGKKFSVVESGSGQKAQENNILEFSFRISNANDSTLFENTQMGRGEYEMFMLPPDSVFDKAIAEGQKIDPMIEMLRMINEGDSAEMEIVASEFFGQMLPPFVKDPTEQVKIGVRAAKLYLSREEYTTVMQERQEEMRKQMEADAEKYIEIDDKLIQEYLTEKGITGAEKTESGLYYVITKEGKGTNPAVGAEVQVHYTGTLLNGNKFDSSVDRGQPFSFPLGQGRVIQGWDEGIQLLNKGAKATLFIPSALGYGPRAMGTDIPANSVLVFDVELIDFNTPASK